FAFQYYKLDKHIDLVNIGKNSQICATLYRDDHKPGPGLISGTFTSSASAINTGYYIIHQVMNNGYLGEDGKIMQMRNSFVTKLKDIHQRHPELIQGPWGMGAM